ncbi:hypothetical protein BH10ACT2_BH10ACT2_20460 [soil metagenome]
MALSIARPDPSSPAEVSAASFSASRRGFDSDEVREFLRLVAAEMARLQDREATLDKELRAAQQAPTVSAAELDEAAAAGLLGEEASRIVATARETAAHIKTLAEEAAARLLQEANEEAHRVRAEAEVEAGRRRQDATLSSEDELQMAKQQGRDMVNEARAYRERVLGELTRRRELARIQIEQLIQNRDRLMESFERSRLIAIDVIAEMAPQAGASELVDLGPITGPVPVIAPKPSPAPEVVAPEVGAPEVGAPEVQAEPAEIAPEPEAVQPELGPELEPELEPVVAATEEREAAVDDLFARLRAQSVKAPKVATKATTAKKASSTAPTATTTAGESPKPQKKATASQLSVFQSSPTEPESVVNAVDSPFGRRDAELAPLIAAGSRNLKRVLADEQNDVLLALRGRQAVRTLVAVLPTVDQHIQRYVDAISEELMVAAEAGAAGINDAPADDQHATIIRKSALAPAIEALATSLVSPLRDRLERAIATADGDNTELVGLTRTVYREWKTRRIDDHIDHVMLMAYGRGAFAVVGKGTPVCWAVDPSGPSCPDAEDNALAGTIGAGDAFPTEHVCAPAHEGCRCMLLRAAR